MGGSRGERDLALRTCTQEVTRLQEGSVDSEDTFRRFVFYHWCFPIHLRFPALAKKQQSLGQQVSQSWSG